MFPKNSLAKRGSITVSRGSETAPNTILTAATVLPMGVFETHTSAASDINEHTRHIFKEVSYMVGYSDPLYFGKVFRKTYGMSPTQVNKQSS